MSFYNWHLYYDNFLYPAGCAPVAIAQIMRYFEHPKTPLSEIGQNFTLAVFDIDGVGTYVNTKIKGGSGPNGSYNWGIMDINPLPENYQILKGDFPSTPEKNSDPNSHEAKVRNEIASLFHDLGALMDVVYRPLVSNAPAMPFVRSSYYTVLTENLGYSSAFENAFFYNEIIKNVIKTNLHKGHPVVIGCMMTGETKGLHLFVVDGYGYMNTGDRKGQTEYFRLNLGFGEGGYRDLWYPLSSFPVILDGDKGSKLDNIFSVLGVGWIRLIHNIMPDQKNKEIYAGHVTLGKNTDLPNLELEVSYTPPSQMGGFSVSGTATEKITVSTDAKGDFAFLIPSNSKIHGFTAKASNVKAGEMRSHLRKSYPDYDFTGESTSAEISGDVIIKEGTVGNKYFDIVFDAAAIVGIENGLLNGIGREYDYPLPFAAAITVGNNWDLSGMKAIYVDPYPYNRYLSQAWFSSLCTKLNSFVYNGGTLIVTGDSYSIAQYISTQAGAGLQLLSTPPNPIHQGNGLTEMFLWGSLQEKVGTNRLNILFTPHEVHGPLIYRMGSKCTVLADANAAFMAGGINYRFERHAAAVSFNHGKGKLIYCSFPIPENIVGGIVDPITGQTPLQAFADWFMSKPLANAELVRLAEAYDIDNMVSIERENSTVIEGKTRGLPVNLKVSGDVTVIAMISDLVMGKVDYSTLSADHDKHRRWTASLFNSADQYHETRTTSADKIVFQVKSNDNDCGTWRIRIENATGYLDKSLFVTMVVQEEREDIIDGGKIIEPGFIPVAGVNISPTSEELFVNSTIQLTANIVPPNATSQDIYWSTISSDIISVDSNGFVTAVSAGTAKVTVTALDGGYTAESVITVKAIPTLVPVTGVTLSSTSANIAVGSTIQLTATVEPSNATSKDVNWSSSNTTVATVNSTGLVSGIAAGTATITVTTVDGNKTATSHITVRIPVSSIQLSPSTLTIEEGKQDTVSIIFTPPNATNQNVSWSTTNSSVATASNGIVSAHSAGTATITATTQDGNKTSTCIVAVTESKLSYYQRKYPNMQVIILPDGGALGQANGNTVIVGNEGNDLIEFSNNGNIFVYEQNGGHDVITSVNVDSGDQNELHFGPGITSADLTFYKEGDDLYITIADITGAEIGSITIVDWYLADYYKLVIVFDDGTVLTPEEVEALVNSYVPVTGITVPSSFGPYGHIDLEFDFGMEYDEDTVTVGIIPSDASDQLIHFKLSDSNGNPSGHNSIDYGFIGPFAVQRTAPNQFFITADYWIALDNDMNGITDENFVLLEFKSNDGGFTKHIYLNAPIIQR